MKWNKKKRSNAFFAKGLFFFCLLRRVEGILRNNHREPLDTSGELVISDPEICSVIESEMWWFGAYRRFSGLYPDTGLLQSEVHPPTEVHNRWLLKMNTFHTKTWGKNGKRNWPSLWMKRKACSIRLHSGRIIWSYGCETIGDGSGTLRTVPICLILTGL